MDKIEKIRQEIERRLKDYWKICFYDVKAYNEDSNVRELKELLAFLDTLSEEPDKSLEEYASRAGFDYVDGIVQEEPGHRWNDNDVEFAYRDGIIAGAKWQADQFEKNRLADCDTLTKEEYDRETAFAAEIIEKEHRQPTFTDAINYGMRLQREQMMKEAVVYVAEPETPIGNILIPFVRIDHSVLFRYGIRVGDKVRIIIAKED